MITGFTLLFSNVVLRNPGGRGTSPHTTTIEPLGGRWSTMCARKPTVIFTRISLVMVNQLRGVITMSLVASRKYVASSLHGYILTCGELVDNVNDLPYTSRADNTASK